MIKLIYVHHRVAALRSELPNGRMNGQTRELGTVKKMRLPHWLAVRVVIEGIPRAWQP